MVFQVEPSSNLVNIRVLTEPNLFSTTVLDDSNAQEPTKFPETSDLISSH